MSVLTVRHLTVYRYRRLVAFGEHRMLLRPAEGTDQRLLSARLDITPAPKTLRWTHDVFGNWIEIATFDVPAAELSFESNVRVDHTQRETPELLIEPFARTLPFTYNPDERFDLSPLIRPQFPDDASAVRDWVQKFLRQGRPTRTADLLMTVTYAIRESFSYIRRTERGIQDPAATLFRGQGTCRDFAVLMMEAVRSLGLAARFVSGYIYIPKRDQGAHVGGGSTHAWCQVYLPGAGWTDFDPTNGIVGNTDLIRVAVAREPSQAVPLHGSWVGHPDDEIGMDVEVLVRRENVEAAEHML